MVPPPRSTGRDAAFRCALKTRRALAYAALLYFLIWGENEHTVDPVRLITSFADALEQGTLIRVEWVECLEPGRIGLQWLRARASAKYSEMLMAVFHVAAANFGLCGCIGARVGRAVSSLEGILESVHSVIWWWHTDRPRE